MKIEMQIISDEIIKKLLFRPGPSYSCKVSIYILQNDNMDMTKERHYKTKTTYPNKKAITQMNTGKIAESIKNIAKEIHDRSFKMRKTVRILHQSGAISELTQAVYEASVAARDTAREIRDTAKDLKRDDMISGTAKAIRETSRAVRVTANTVKDMATDTTETPKAIMTRLPEWP